MIPLNHHKLLLLLKFVRCLSAKGGGPENVTVLGGLSTNKPKFDSTKDKRCHKFGADTNSLDPFDLTETIKHVMGHILGYFTGLPKMERNF